MAPDSYNKLAPGFREFFLANPRRLPPLYGTSWSSAFRQPPPGSPLEMGAEPPIPIGTQRVIDLGNFSVQVMVPD
ncbi:hypothetical protein FRC11_009953, partial [Ceratobasidium sp. 423]